MGVDSVMRVAWAFKDMHEEGGDNHGQVPERFLKFVKSEVGQPWCAAFVSYVGYYGNYDVRAGTSSWPLVLTASCAELGVHAQTKSLLKTFAVPNAVFLLYFPSKQRFAHTGFCIEDLGNGKWRTIEGNTNHDGSREGYEVAVRTRSFGQQDRFIHWA